MNRRCEKETRIPIPSICLYHKERSLVDTKCPTIKLNLFDRNAEDYILEFPWKYKILRKYCILYFCFLDSYFRREWDLAYDFFKSLFRLN